MDSPLFELLTQISIAAERGLDLLAIGMAVAVPDICSSLISDDGRTTPDRYKRWCEENLTAGFEYVTADDLYSMRCGVLHNGRSGDLKHNVSRVIFIPGGGSSFTNCLSEDVYIYSTLGFCRNINRAAVKWYEANLDHPNIKANIDRLMQYRLDGFAPHFGGRPVVA